MFVVCGYNSKIGKIYVNRSFPILVNIPYTTQCVATKCIGTAAVTSDKHAMCPQLQHIYRYNICPCV